MPAVTAHQKRVVLRKNKRGNVTKILREHYLRTDIHCGWSECELCIKNAYAPRRVLVPIENDTRQHQQLIILDSSVPIDQMDVLDHQVFKNVVVLRTVLDAVRNKSMAQYSRLRNMIDDEARSFYVFSNEFMKYATDLYIFGCLLMFHVEIRMLREKRESLLLIGTQGRSSKLPCGTRVI